MDCPPHPELRGCRDAMHRVSTVHTIPVRHTISVATRRRQASNLDNPVQAAGAARGRYGSPAARTAKQFNRYAVVEGGRAPHPELRYACTGLSTYRASGLSVRHAVPVIPRHRQASGMVMPDARGLKARHIPAQWQRLGVGGVRFALRPEGAAYPFSQPRFIPVDGDGRHVALTGRRAGCATFHSRGVATGPGYAGLSALASPQKNTAIMPRQTLNQIFFSINFNSNSNDEKFSI
jgi:hypothetical protein